jgi:hypothetical protein
MKVKSGTLALIRRFSEPGGVGILKAKVPARSQREMRLVLKACFESIMERRLRTAKYLKT